MLLEEVTELLVRRPLDQRAHGDVAELALGLTLELGVLQPHRDDGGEPLPDVLAEEVGVLLLQQALGPGVGVDAVGQALLEALHVHAALDGVDPVGEAVETVGVVAGVPLERDLHLHRVLDLLEVADPAEEGLLGGVHVLDEVDDAAGVAEDDGLRLGVPVVLEADLEALVQEGHHLQALDQGLGPELDLVEDGGVRPEADGGAGAVPGRLAGDLELGLELAALGEVHEVALALAVDLDLAALGEGVDDRHAHTVEPAGDLVALTAELAAGVQDREHGLGRRLALGHLVGGDAPAVVADLTAAVGQEGHVDAGAVARHRLVHRVVDDLVDEVVQAAGTGAADVHPGPLADGLQAFQDGDVLGGVGRCCLGHAATILSASRGREKWRQPTGRG